MSTKGTFEKRGLTLVFLFSAPAFATASAGSAFVPVAPTIAPPVSPAAFPHTASVSYVTATPTSSSVHGFQGANSFNGNGSAFMATPFNNNNNNNVSNSFNMSNNTAAAAVVTRPPPMAPRIEKSVSMPKFVPVAACTAVPGKMKLEKADVLVVSHIFPGFPFRTQLRLQ